MSEEGATESQAWDERRVLLYLIPACTLVWMFWPLVLMFYQQAISFLLSLGWPTPIFNLLESLAGGNQMLIVGRHGTWVQTFAFVVLVACGIRVLQWPRSERVAPYRAAALSAYCSGLIAVLVMSFFVFPTDSGPYVGLRAYLVGALQLLTACTLVAAAVGHWRRRRWAAWCSFAVPILPWIGPVTGITEPNHPDWTTSFYTHHPGVWEILGEMDAYSLRYAFWLLQESTDEIFHFTAALVALRLYTSKSQRAAGDSA